MIEGITKHPVSLFTEPSTGLYRIYKDYYWIVDKEKNILRFGECSWQTNANKDVVENIRDTVYPDLDILLIPYIYIPFTESFY